MSSLLRSTKFVRYFTGAARTLILNTAKTAEVSTLINSKALSAVNNVGIRDYATTKKTESLEPLLQKLDLEVRKYGRITKRDIDEVFDELRGKNDITSSQSLLVIRCCGELVPEELPEQRTLLVQKIWSVLTERGVPMDISHYNALLRVYLENEHQFSPAKFLEELEKKGLLPNRVTYQRLMWRYCQEGDVEGATKVLEKMRELNFPVSEPVLNALVMGHAFHGDTEGAKAVLETMATAGLEPSNRTYTLLACGYAKKGDIEGVENVIKTATQKEALLTDKDVLEVIEHLSLGGHGDKVEQLFTHLNKGFGYNQEVCNVILRLLNKGHDDVAKKLMHTMPKSSTAEDTPFKGAFFIKQLLRLNKSPSTVIKTCKELRDEGLIPNAIFIATEGALQQGQVELAQELFKELKNEGKEVRQHYFWPLLAQKGKEGDEEGLLQIVRNMIGEGLSPSGETLRDYVIPYLVGKDTTENIILKLQIANVPAVHAARNLMAELLDAGDIKKAADVAVLYRPRGQYGLLSRPLIHAVSKSKDIDSFATILHVLCSNPPSAQAEQDSANDDVQTEDKGDSDEVGRIVKATVKSLHKPELAAKLLKALHSKGIRISADAAEEIQQHLGQNLTTDLSELLAQLTSSDLEHVPLESPKRTIERNSAQLEQLISRLKSREGTNVNRLQKQLLNVYMKENNVEKLNSYLKELKASNFELNMITLAQLFEFYCVNDQIEKADEIQAIIHEKDPEFVLSNLKVMQKAHALVRAKKYDEAFQFLKENKAKPGQDSTSFLYNSKCWQILNTLAENKDADNVKRFTDLLIDEGYIEASNVILGPSVKVNLLNDDLDGALKAFEESTKKYRSTPWKGELMKVLILKEDASKLQWLADLSTQIHGEVNILHDLVLAFVECGRLRQARRILETPGMHARQRRLDDACQRYLEEGKSEHLEGLLEATKELSHIDRSNIFYHLLVTYCKANETDKALGLWTLLQEEGEVPSDQFLTYLGQHLKSKKMSVPFIIPSEKVQVTQQVTSPKPKKAAVKEANNKPTKKEISDKIENFVKDGKVEQAFGLAIKSLKENVIPKPGVMKFMLKAVAETGDVEKLQELGKLVNENMKREITFDNKLTHAEFVRGRGADHVEALLRDVTAASDHELDVMLRRFPRSNTLASVLNDDNIASKCHKIAEIAASKGQLLAANLLWIEYILEGRQKEADSLWKLWLNNASILLFRRLLQEAHLRKEPQLIQKLIDALTTNKNVTQGSLGNAYSRLINLYLLDEKTNEALSAYERAIKSGVTLNHFNRHCIERLKSAAEAKGVEFKQPAN